MAKIVIKSVCVVEGDPLDVMEHYQSAVEAMADAACLYGEGDTRVVLAEGMDFDLTNTGG